MYWGPCTLFMFICNYLIMYYMFIQLLDRHSSSDRRTRNQPLGGRLYQRWHVYFILLEETYGLPRHQWDVSPQGRRDRATMAARTFSGKWSVPTLYLRI